MLFLGTAAAECCPNPFCSCDFCERIRNSTDSRERRRRSALLLDQENLIDFGPDALSAAALFGIDLSHLKIYLSPIFMKIILLLWTRISLYVTYYTSGSNPLYDSRCRRRNITIYPVFT